MFLGDVAAGNSCFGRAAQEIRKKGEGPGVLGSGANGGARSATLAC
jgi:hypothetical protein